MLRGLVQKADEWPKDFDVYALFKKSEEQSETIKILTEALEDLLNHGLQYENGEIHQADPVKAQQALDRVRGK